MSLSVETFYLNKKSHLSLLILLGNSCRKNDNILTNCELIFPNPTNKEISRLTHFDHETINVLYFHVLTENYHKTGINYKLIHQTGLLSIFSFICNQLMYLSWNSCIFLVISAPYRILIDYRKDLLITKI